MDVLLINSPLFDDQVESGAYGDPPPLGLGYVGTSLRSHGYEVALLDAVAERLSLEQIQARVAHIQPELLGINVFSTNLPLVESIVGRSSTSRIVVGGPAARHLADTVLAWDSPNTITVVDGEAEHALPALLDGRARDIPWHDSPNRRTFSVDTSSPWFPNSIDLPLDRTLFQHEPIWEAQWGVWEAHVVTSRGCGHDCAFCSAARSANPRQKIRHRSDSHISCELADLRNLYPKLDCVRVLDDLFLRNATFIERAAQMFAARELKWRAMAHVAGLSRATTKAFRSLAESGCLELFVGVESGSPTRRIQIGKTEDLSATEYVARGILTAGVSVKAYFVIGFPEETESEMLATYEFASRIAKYSHGTPGQFRVSAFKFRPYHGTRLYHQLVANGWSPRPLGEDLRLAALHGRRPYDFAGDNFSAVSTERLNQILSSLLELNR